MGEPVEKTLWGELRPEEDTEEEESEEDEDEDEDDDEAGLETPSGLETPGGMTSTVPSEFGGAESIGGEFTLRKQRRGTETEESTAPRSAYQVLPEHSIRAQGFFGGERAYDLKAAQQNLPVLGEENNRRKRKAGDVDVSMDVDALARDDKLNKDELKKQYEAQRKAEAQGQWGTIDQDDLSAMIADESRKRLKKDEEKRSRR
jgi:splicing factor 3B subunit 2